MANLAEIVNQTSPGAVVEACCAANQRQRNHLGLSEIGHKCDRYLWYKHNGYQQKPIEGRVLRLFRLGELIEEQAIVDLKSAGYAVHSQQKEVHFSHNGIELVGHIDGVIEGLLESKKPHLFECKSANKKGFDALKKLGSYEQWSEKYKAQIHVYMLGMKLQRCLVWVECKDNSEVYTERIALDREFAIRTLERAFSAIWGATPPERKCPRADWYEAKWCGFFDVCF